MFKKIANSFFFAALVMLAACGGSGSADSQAQDVMSVDDVLDNAPALVDNHVTFEGVCSHTCKHGARKIFLLGSDESKVIRVEAAQLGSFDTQCVHRPVTVTGIVREQRIDTPYLDAWEARVVEADAQDREAGCETERSSRGIEATTAAAQIAEYRARIAERDSLEGVPYLSFYYVDAESYQIGE